MREIIYEDYEPELRVWPYTIAALIFPLIPLFGNMHPYLNGGGSSFLHWAWNIMSALPVFMVLISTSRVMRTGEGCVMYLITGLYWIGLSVFQWAYNTYMGKPAYALGVPLLTYLSPALLFFSAYSFYRKRRRLEMGLRVNTLVFFLAAAAAAYLYLKSEGSTGYRALIAIYPALVALISLSVFITTGRSERTPGFVALVLSLMVLSSLLLFGDFRQIAMILKDASPVSGAKVLILYIYKSVLSNYIFWATLSSSIAFGGLAVKSCYHNYETDDEVDETIYPERRPEPVPEEDKYQRAPSAERYERAPNPERYERNPEPVYQPPVRESDPLEDERVRKEFEEWKEYRRLTGRASQRQDEPKVEEAEEKSTARERLFGDEPDMDSKDKWYQLLREEIPDDEFSLRR